MSPTRTGVESLQRTARDPVGRAAIGGAAGWVLSMWVVGGDAPAWRAPASAAVIALAALSAPGVDRWAGRGVTSAWALATAIGLYLCVPETGHVVGVIAMLIVVWAAELAGRARVDALVVVGIEIVLVWAALRGAAGRSGALVAGFALLGLLVLATPASRAPRPRTELVPSALRDPLLVVLQLVFAVVVARLGGVRTTTSEAAIVSTAGLCLLGAAAWMAMGPGPRPTSPRRRSAA